MQKPPTTDAAGDDLIATLQAQLAALQGELHAVSGELKVVKVERDLLRERVAAFEHRLFAARSEVRHADQRDLFFNEAEMLDRGEAPPQEKVGVPAHSRSQRGRKPLVPAKVRVIRHERVKYACPCCDGGMKIIAPVPVKP